MTMVLGYGEQKSDETGHPCKQHMLLFMVLKTHTNNNKTTLGEGPVNENTGLHSFPSK